MIGELFKDILYFYYLQIEEGSFLDDLNYRDCFNKRYWEFVSSNNYDVDADDADFITQGCLLITLSMCSELISGAGRHIEKDLEDCIVCLKQGVETSDSKLLELAKHVLCSAEFALTDPGFSEVSQFDRRLDWVYEEFIKGFFVGLYNTIERSE